MGRSRTSGIISDEDGNKVVNKVYHGRRIFRRLGAVTQEEAEQWLARQTEERRKAREFGTRPERNFADAAEKYLIERAHKASIDTDALHISALLPFIGKRTLRQIHDATLEPFKTQRRRDGVSETTIKRALEVVRCILNLAARSWRDEHGLTWLETAPLITMPDTRKTARKPYPLSWDEQRRLFALLPGSIAQMALFAVNTGCREQEVCQLRWEWELPVPELQTSVFVIPAEFGGRSERSGVKNREDRVVVLNDVAKRLIDAQRGLHREFVFVGSKGKPRKPIRFMNNTAWQTARKKAGLAQVRVHDLKHTFGRRLRTAGVPLETRKVLLGHKTGDITSHYSAPELSELIRAANAVLKAQESTLLRVVTKQDQGVYREKSRKSRADVRQSENGPGAAAPNPLNVLANSGAPGRI
jgi:integrase